VLLAAKYLLKHPLESERPLLNKRVVQLIGQSFDLVDPIANGRGSIKTGDTIWRMEGPELPQGARIRVVGADGTPRAVAQTVTARAGDFDLGEADLLELSGDSIVAEPALHEAQPDSRLIAFALLDHEARHEDFSRCRKMSLRSYNRNVHDATSSRARTIG